MAINGIHHLAISTVDIKRQIAFFTEVLGLELVALYWMHGVPETWHGFIKLNDFSYLAFVQGPGNGTAEPVIGVSHAANTGGPSAGGTMQHVSFNVDDLDALMAMRDRLRVAGVPVFGPLDHGMCHSIYFAGPEGLNLEIATSAEAIDRRQWIDPEVVGLAGISEEEIKRYTARRETPAPTNAGAVPQPEFDSAKPHLIYPEKVYQKLLAMPDEEYARRFSVPDAPVPLEG